MPQGDRTGPKGMGPKTGRGAGNCSLQGQNRSFGQGKGQGNQTRCPNKGIGGGRRGQNR